MKRIFVDRDVDISDSIFVSLGSLYKRKGMRPFQKTTREEFSDIVVLNSWEDYTAFVDLFGTQSRYLSKRNGKFITRKGNDIIFIISLWTENQKGCFYTEVDENLFLCQFNIIHLLVESFLYSCVTEVELLIPEKKPLIYMNPILSLEIRLETFQPNFDDGH